MGSGSLSGLFLTFCLVMISACSASPRVVDATEIVAPDATRIYVVRRGWHTGFVIPSQIIRSRLPELTERFGETALMEFGWGDRAYYQARDKSLGMTIRAVLWPSDAIVYTRAVTGRPDQLYADARVEALCLDSEQFSLLVNFIENSFYRDELGNIVFSQDGLEENSLFFKGTGEYYLFNTCNTWTARGLKSARLDVSPTLKVQAGSVMRSLARNMPEDAADCDSAASVAAL